MSARPYTRREKRLAKELAESRTEAFSLRRQVDRAKTRDDCYHEPHHRYSCYRRAGGKHFAVVRCGYCGKEVAGREVSEDEAWLILEGEDNPRKTSVFLRLFGRP